MPIVRRKPASKKPLPLDSFIGQRIRQARKACQLSQERAGEAIGVSFQQMQKYENGANRISAANLVTLAAALGYSPSWFLEPAGPASESKPRQIIKRDLAGAIATLNQVAAAL